MPKKSSSAFDELLEQFATYEDRQALAGLAERYPTLKESVLRQSDYSRQSNELREQVEYAKKWRDWESQNWVPEHNKTRYEYELEQEAARLKAEKDEAEQRLALAALDGDNVNLEELEKQLLGKVNSQIAAKEAELKAFVQQSQGVTSATSLKIPELMFKHSKEFGETFDPNAFLQEAVSKQRWDLDDFYEKDFVASKREAAKARSYEDRLKAAEDKRVADIAAAQAEAEAKIEKIRGMSAGSLSDAGGTQMGAFQRQYLSMNNDQNAGPKIPDGVKLGDGAIAKIAAQYEMDKAAGRI